MYFGQICLPQMPPMSTSDAPCAWAEFRALFPPLRRASGRGQVALLALARHGSHMNQVVSNLEAPDRADRSEIAERLGQILLEFPKLLGPAAAREFKNFSGRSTELDGHLNPLRLKTKTPRRPNRTHKLLLCHALLSPSRLPVDDSLILIILASLGRAAEDCSARGLRMGVGLAAHGVQLAFQLPDLLGEREQMIFHPPEFGLQVGKQGNDQNAKGDPVRQSFSR